MKNIYFTTLLVISFTMQTLTAQTIFTQWNFDGSATTPNFGIGNMSLIGGTVESGTAYPNGNPASGKSYSITGFPADTNASATAGFRFNVDTSGYTDITVAFDMSGTNQSSKWQQYEYTTDGTNWLVLGNNASTGLLTVFLSKSIILPAACNNNPNFGFRIVSIFTPPTGTSYASIQGGNYNGTIGRWNVDNVNFSFNPLKRNSFQNDTFNLFPNPVKNTPLNITSLTNGEIQVSIYDMLGKQVLTSKVLNNKVNVAELNAGIYIVRITEEGKTATRKLVIQ